MDVIDKLYIEWAWRSKSGTPSMDNAEDKAILNKLVAELTNADGQISKAEVIDAIQKGEFTPEQLKSILNGISGVAYKDDVLSFLNKQGKSVASISKTIYNRMVENGDIQTYHKYITDGAITYADLGTSGNLKSKFSKLFSQETINFLFDIKPQIGNVATGKGEVLLCALTADVNGDAPSGDVGVGNKGIEVKNRGAIPMGQKAQFGKNTDKKFIQDAISAVNLKLDNPIQVETKGKRPLHRLNIILAAVAEQESDKIDVSIDAMDNALRSNYPGLDFSDFNLKKYKKGNAIDADAAEQAFSKKVIKLYTETEEFEEIFFLDDKSGNYAIVPADKLVDAVGSKISIYMKDGLPRFSYNF
jgi:ketosteroid isomerase-like protein